MIDISRLRGPDREQLLAELRHAARDVGFFYVVGHGVPDRLTTGIFEVAREFFALPIEQRLAIENIHSPQFRGYTRTGYEYTGGKPDWREQIDIGPEREAVPRAGAAPVWKRLIGPNQWPAGLPEQFDFGAWPRFSQPDQGKRFVDRLELFSHLANIGDVRSLVIHPASTTHAQLTVQQQQQRAGGVTPGLIRLPVGLEGLADLTADLERGIDHG